MTSRIPEHSFGRCPPHKEVGVVCLNTKSHIALHSKDENVPLDTMATTGANYPE